MSKTIQNKVTNCETISWRELKTYEFNTLKDQSSRDVTKLKNSIVNSGFNSPFYLWDNHNYVIDGTGRQLALLELEKEGLEIPNLPVVKIQAESKKEALKLVMQVSSQHGQISQTSLADFTSADFEIEELKELQLEELNLGELELMLGNLETEELEAQEDDFEVPDHIKTDIVKGDIFEFRKGGKTLHRLMCGDSTSVDEVEKLMNGEKSDMVFTDPPYGIAIVGGNGKVGGDNKAKNGVYSEVIGDDTTDTAKEFYNTCVSLGMENFIIWGGNYFTDFLPFSNSWIVWDKRGDMNSNNFADGEMAWCSFNTRVRIYTQLWNGMIREGEKDKRIHPTQKPIRTLSEIINDHVKGDLIFDGFLGSGSTMVASHQLKRKCYGMELDERYCQVICDRMKKLDPDLEIIKI